MTVVAVIAKLLTEESSLLNQDGILQPQEELLFPIESGRGLEESLDYHKDTDSCTNQPKSVTTATTKDGDLFQKVCD